MLSFTAEDLALLRGKLAELQLPLHFEDRMTFDDGHGILRLPQGWDTHIDFHWRGQPAEAWRPLLGWMRVVHDLIPEKVWDDALRE